MLAWPKQVKVWFSEDVSSLRCFALLRASVAKEGGELVNQPPETDGFCVFARFSGDLKICTTGLDEPAKVEQLVRYLGGQFTNEFKATNTHLLAGKTDTLKFATAAGMKIPILRPRYAFDTWEKQSTDPETQILRLPEIDYALSPFSCVVLCITGFSERKKTQISADCDRVGIVFQKDLTKSVTHLIVYTGKGSAIKPTIKIKFAQQWGIAIVTFAWLTDSLKAQCPLLAAPYTLPLPRITGETCDSEASFRESSSELGLSVLAPALLVAPPPAAPMDVTTAQPLPSSMHAARFACVGFDEDETAEIGNMLKSKGALLVCPDERPHFIIAPHSPDLQQVSALSGRLVTTQFVQRCGESNSLLSPDECFIFSPLPLSLPLPLFASVVLYTHGFSTQETRSIALGAKTLGARHFGRIGPSLTHCICRGAAPPELPPTVPLVAPKWLFRSALEGRLLPTANFPPEQPQVIVPAPAPLPPAASRPPPAAAVDTAAAQANAIATSSSNLLSALDTLAKSSAMLTTNPEPLQLRSRWRSYNQEQPRAEVKHSATRANLEADDGVDPGMSQVSAFLDVRYEAPLIRALGSPPTSHGTPGPRCFMISQVHGEARSRIEQEIRTLRGDLAGENWSSRVTHLITAEPKNTLKFLCALAAGVHAVQPDYVTQSARAGKWLSEAHFAWSPQQCPASGDLINALLLWQRKKRPAFSDWHVLLLLKNELATYEALMRAGGARTEADTEKFLALVSKQKKPSSVNSNDSGNSAPRWLALVPETPEERAGFKYQRERLKKAGIPMYRSLFPIQFLETVGEAQPAGYLESSSE